MVAAQLALTPQKRRRVLLCAQRFLMNHTSFTCYQPRFDVACVTFRGRQVVELEYYPNAFSLYDTAL